MIINDFSIKYYNEQSPIFVDKIDPATKQKLKTTQAYVNFFDLVVPPRLSGHYLEEFNRIQNYQKDMSESEKVNSVFWCSFPLNPMRFSC